MNNAVSPLLLIRADATRQMGSGHVMRTLALARDWRTRGGRVLFVSHCDSPAMRARLDDFGLPHCRINAPHPDATDLPQTLEAIERHRPACILLDGYHFTAGYQQAIQNAGSPVALLDDLAHHSLYHADLIVNQNAYAADLTYRCAGETRIMRGTRCALLRPEFDAWRAWQRQTLPVAHNVLVTMGGSDPDNATAKVIQALQSWRGQHYDVQVVVGPANPHLFTLRGMVEESSGNIALVTSPPDMPSLMAWADLAVAAAGTTALELAFMQVPTLALVLADNQERVAAAHHAAGSLHNLGRQETISPQNLACAIRQLAASVNRRDAMARKGRLLVDGMGLRRVGSEFWKLAVESRSKPLECLSLVHADRRKSVRDRRIQGERRACCA